ncbi:hypothetical protein HUO13_09960 [Saccharopolyspora erythraea]|uniref:hypothetical protein n=1 Tax=Saccharopolyspora erythraea TaxID=1836 RepID=UPI001BA4825B|nr:hypothetical protein [Saccharopolyspora erythraea]QUH01102.1 hypothetical protein HUO13_09960 [Saccharopolyspora erythraea]
MRLVRLGPELTEVGADIRAALAAWGEGTGVSGGVAVFGCRPPGSPRKLDAVVVLPRGVIVVVGVDLPDPVLKLEAPIQTPWSVDGWPMVRTEGAVNPALEALESASALARSLQTRGAEPLPVTTIVAVGPYVEQVTQPTSDLHRGLRVLHPTTTSMLAAARELATYERDCSVEKARQLLAVLGEEPGALGVAELAAEGFSDDVAPDLAVIDTMLIPKVGGEPAPAPAPKPPAAARAIVPRHKLIALAAGVVVVLGVVLALLLGGGSDGPDAQQEEAASQRVDGVSFTERAVRRETDCGRASYGDVQAWLQTRPCTALTRLVFDAEVSQRGAAVAVAIVELPDEGGATELRNLLNTAGTGGVTDLVAAGQRWPGAPDGFDSAAQAVEQTGKQVRIVQAVWSRGYSDPDDVALRSLAERGLRLRA